jgi:hypothetical protein
MNNHTFTKVFSIFIYWVIFVALAFGSIALFFYNGAKLQHWITYIAGFTGGLAYTWFGLSMEATFPKLAIFKLGKKKHLSTKVKGG